MSDLSALWDESATQEDVVAAYQTLIDTGQAWLMDGHTGRTAYRLIESGLCVLGPTGFRDYWGGYVPSRFEVVPGTKGSIEYAAARTGRA